jgi:hypothetical protein
MFRQLAPTFWLDGVQSFFDPAASLEIGRLGSMAGRL